MKIDGAKIKDLRVRSMFQAWHVMGPIMLGNRCCSAAILVTEWVYLIFYKEIKSATNSRTLVSQRESQQFGFTLSARLETSNESEMTDSVF